MNAPTPATVNPAAGPLQAIAPNRWHGQPDPAGYRLSGHPWARYRFVVLKRYANGWHVGFCNGPTGKQDSYWHSGISEARARELFAMASAPLAA